MLRPRNAVGLSARLTQIANAVSAPAGNVVVVVDFAPLIIDEAKDQFIGSLRDRLNTYRETRAASRKSLFYARVVGTHGLRWGK
jgi:hypothetical protein